MKKWLIGLSVVVALVAGWFLRLMWLAGEFKKLEPHFAGECTPVFGAVGAEDIVIHRAAGVAFISAGRVPTRRALPVRPLRPAAPPPEPHARREPRVPSARREPARRTRGPRDPHG